LQILIGNAYYNCSCIRYVTPESERDMSIVIILSVGFGVLLILIVITVVVGIVCGCGKCRNRAREDANAFYVDGNNYTEFGQDDTDRQFDAMPAAEANAYCSPGPTEPEEPKEYTSLGAVGPPEPSNDSPPYYFPPEKDYKC